MRIIVNQELLVRVSDVCLDAPHLRHLALKMRRFLNGRATVSLLATLRIIQRSFPMDEHFTGVELSYLSELAGAEYEQVMWQ